MRSMAMEIGMEGSLFLLVWFGLASLFGFELGVFHQSASNSRRQRNTTKIDSTFWNEKLAATAMMPKTKPSKAIDKAELHARV